jgi:hypothetical protein
VSRLPILPVFGPSARQLYWQQLDAHIGAGLRKAGIAEK